MITYSLKTVFCSALLIVIYFLILEKEKMHFFNRFYLLFAVLFSFIAPLVTFKSKIPVLLQIGSTDVTSFNIQSTANQQLLSIKQNGSLLSDLFLLAYLIVTAFLFIRFLTNLYHIWVKIRCSNTIDYTKSKIILTNEHSTPHSFLNYIFIPARNFKEGNIEKEILTHELAHVKQRHTLDIILIEIITVFAWINPFLFLYKRAVQLNHEFLADEFVIKAISDIYSYQMLLLGKATRPITITFTSPFNHLDIKKRIIMMNKKVSFKSAILKQIALIQVFAIIALLFASRIVAQEPTWTNVQTPSAQQGVSQDLLNEYQSILDKYKIALPDGKTGYDLTLSQEDNDKLEEIFFQMSKEQQDNQMFILVPKNAMVLPKTVPTQEQFDSFKDPNIYGVWIDGNRVNNEELKIYRSTDFSSVFVSKLQSNAKNYGKHEYQVNLMTNTGYGDYYSRTISQKGYYLMPVRTQDDVITR